ncbi:deoxyhypusine synthase, partial [Candidatus Woesearchaeota archaeon]|nr:deoxyhypusine synthase [Candidatus Woesearchaeota archaeon]
RKWETLDDFPKIRGFDFEKSVDFSSFLDSFSTTGIQATELAKGIKIADKMIQDKATIFLSFTSNMVSSGNREIIKFLVKHKLVHALVASAGAVEEDLIKCLRPFVLGSFDTPGRMLFDTGVGRIGNIFAPYDRYLYFEKFAHPVFDKIYEQQKKNGKPFTPSELIREFGKAVNNKDSIMYWAYKNDIPVFCPAVTDGSIGDLMYFQKQKKKDFYIDVVGDHYKIVKFCLEQEKTGAILLGGSVPKHYTLNANIFREGLDYAVYITTANEFDASDSGGNPQEAMSWAKIKLNAPHVKIKVEASVAFPLLVAGSFAKRFHEKKNL